MQRWGRDELLALMAARRDAPEGTGPGSVLDLRVRVSPDVLERILGATLTWDDGTHARLDGVQIGDDGYATPIITTYLGSRGGGS